MGDFYTRHEVYVNNKRVPLATEVSFDNIGLIEEQVSVIDDPYDRYIPISETTSGRVNFKVPQDNYVNTPITFLEALGFRMRYHTYNTSTSSYEYSDVYDFSDFDVSSSELCSPKIPIELRQIQVSGDVAIASGGTYDQYAFPIKLPGEITSTLKLKCREASDSDVTSVQVEIFEDSSGEPAGSKLTNSTTLNPSIDPADGATYASAEWLSIDISTLMGTATYNLTDTYWIVITATDVDNLYICYNSNNNYPTGPLKLNSGTWITSTTMVDPVFIFVGEHTYGGHTVKIISYNEDKSHYRTITMQGCKVYVNPPTPSPQKASDIGFNFTSYQSTITYT